MGRDSDLLVFFENCYSHATLGEVESRKAAAGTASGDHDIPIGVHEFPQ
jgi:hypothetical protein